LTCLQRVVLAQDELNISIIGHLPEGRESFKPIAEDLGVSDNTIRSCVGKLEQEGVLAIVGLVDPEAIPQPRLVMVGVKLSSMDLVAKGEAFSRLRGVLSVSVVTGRFDLILVDLLKEGFGLLEF
jgi:Lrp/AsnC family transcriptional regulator, regulator for asnA, asnC and gidA